MVTGEHSVSFIFSIAPFMRVFVPTALVTASGGVATVAAVQALGESGLTAAGIPRVSRNSLKTDGKWIIVLSFFPPVFNTSPLLELCPGSNA